MPDTRTIVVAVDFSEPSNVALETAIALAKQFGAKLHLLHAFELPQLYVTPYEVAVPDAYLSEARAASIEKLAALAKKVSEAGLEVETQLEEVSAASAVVRAAEKLKADLIVVGTHGYTGIKHALLGSVAEKISRLAPCSVLIAKSEPA